MLVIKPVLIFHIIDRKLLKHPLNIDHLLFFSKISSQTGQHASPLLFSVLSKISCYGWFDWAQWVLIASDEMAHRELRYLKREAAKCTTIVSLACEDRENVVKMQFDFSSLNPFPHNDTF